jgi:hypothetical protein
MNKNWRKMCSKQVKYQERNCKEVDLKKKMLPATGIFGTYNSASMQIDRLQDIKLCDKQGRREDSSQRGEKKEKMFNCSKLTRQ